MTNLEISELLRAVAAAYKLKDSQKNKFRIVAYERAADAVEHLTSEAKDMWDEGKLDDIPGVGESIAAHLDEIFKTGKSKHFAKIMQGFPPAIFELMKVPGIGPKTAFKLSRKLGITEAKGAMKKLEKAVAQGRVSDIPGFGEQSAESMQKSIKEASGRTKRMLLPYASELAAEIVAWIKKEKNVSQVEPLGSLRRRAATVGDIDIAAATKNPEKTLIHFTKYPKAKRVLEKGERTASIILPGDIQVDLMVQGVASFGALLQHFTGSKHHNIALREMALKKSMSLSEYGIKVKGKLEKFADEKAFYKKLGLDWIPPELREDAGEIEAAKNKSLPKLVEPKDVKADLQIHSNFDIETSHDLGISSMEEVIKAAGVLEYEYLAFTEHNPSQSGHNDKQVVEILKKKRDKIDEINSSLVKGMKRSVKKVFNSLEVDILPDGNLPLPDKAFDFLDFILVSIHSSFRLSRVEMTKRVLRALDYPKVKIFAHPTARKLNKREGIELNWPEIFKFCKTKNIWLEVNGDPMRLDLPDFLIREGKKAGVKFSLGTDSHHQEGLNNMQWAVFMARRGWLTTKDIVNTKSLHEFEKLIV